jgi:4a-hydroxytetrahydrobiopterin dehydratase
MNRTLLAPDELQAGVAGLSPNWSVTGTNLLRTVKFPTFLTAVEFISSMAPIAERLDHHPDVRLSWRTVELTLSTHSAGGLTAYDLALAKELDPVIDRLTTPRVGS